MKEWLIFRTMGLKVMVKQYEMKMECAFALKGIELDDRVFDYKDISLKKFIETEGTEKEKGSNDLVKISLNLFEENHP